MTPYQQLCVDFFALCGAMGPTILNGAAPQVAAVIDDIIALAPPPPPTTIPAVRPGGAAIPAVKH